MVDFEYGGANCAAYDIGNHFCEFAGQFILLSVKYRGGGRMKTVHTVPAHISIMFQHKKDCLVCKSVNHYTGITDPVDYNRYPNKAVQCKWIKYYLEETARISGQYAFSGNSVFHCTIGWVYTSMHTMLHNLSLYAYKYITVLCIIWQILELGVYLYHYLHCRTPGKLLKRYYKLVSDSASCLFAPTVERAWTQL